MEIIKILKTVSSTKVIIVKSTMSFIMDVTVIRYNKKTTKE